MIHSNKTVRFTLFSATLILATLGIVNTHASFADDTAASAPVAKAGAGDHESVEVRIKELHDKLKITQDQEGLWSKVTQEMRDTAKAHHDLANSRTDKSAKMTAIEDLTSYAEIAKSHADSMTRFLNVFTPLYTAMSDDQKKNADQVFRGHKDEHSKKHKADLNKKK